MRCGSPARARDGRDTQHPAPACPASEGSRARGEEHSMTETAPRIQTPYLVPEDELDRSLRPRRLQDFVGQEALREQLAVAIEASTARGDALDHVLLAGPPGLGKTSLAQIVAAVVEGA